MPYPHSTNCVGQCFLGHKCELFVFKSLTRVKESLTLALARTEFLDEDEQDFFEGEVPGFLSWAEIACKVLGFNCTSQIGPPMGRPMSLGTK